MKNLEAVVSELQKKLDEKDEVREIAIKSARAINRLSGGVVHGVHKGVPEGPGLNEAMEEAERLKSLLHDHPEVWHSGIVQDALQELAEAAIVVSILRDLPLPTPEQLDMPGPTYLMGFADAIGELRRFTLEALRNGRLEEAERNLDMMEEMFLGLMRFDYPEAIVSIRRKQDIARSILEKTRGDVAVAASTSRLEGKVESLERELQRRG